MSVKAASLVPRRSRSLGVLLVGCLFIALGSLTVTPTTSQAQGTITGTVLTFDMFGNLVPVENALVVATSGSLTFSTRTAGDGSFELTVAPGTYDVVVSATASLNPSFIVGHVYQSSQDMMPVAGVTVTAEPVGAGEVAGGSATTDSTGFFNLTVRPLVELQPGRSSVVVAEGSIVTMDFHLLATASPSEPVSFALVFTHPLYVKMTQVVSEIFLSAGQSLHVSDIFMNNGPPSTLTVDFHESSYVPVVYTNSSASGLVFDADTRALNFTVSGTDGTIGSFVVVVPKALFDGTPVVLIDNVLVPSAFTENETEYVVRFDCALSTHAVAVGGSNTIPEFPAVCLVLAVSTLATVILERCREHFLSK